MNTTLRNKTALKNRRRPKKLEDNIKKKLKMTSKRNLKTTSKKDEDNLKIFKKRVTLKNKKVKKT